MVLVFIYTLFTIFFAWLNFKWISKGKEINHFLNGVLHCVVAVVIGVSEGWQFGLATLFSVRAVFDSSLNYFRHLRLGYISPYPKSFIDRIEKKFILWIVPKITNHTNVDNEVRIVSVWLKVFYLLCAIILCVI